MSGAIHYNGEQLAALQKNMVDVATDIAQVANGAYVTGDLFIESDSSLANGMNQMCADLARCANDMYALCLAMGAYFQKVIVEMNNWDEQTYLAAISAAMADLPNRPAG